MSKKINKSILLTFLAVFIQSNSYAMIVKGKVYDREHEPTKQIFEFIRIEKNENNKKIVTVEFKDLAGKTAVFEKLVYPNQPQGDILFESYDYERFQNNEVVKIYPKESKLHFEYKKQDKIKNNEEAIEKNTITRDQLVSHVQLNWEKLIKGEKIKSRFIVPDRAETIGFGLTEDGEEEINGVKTVRIAMKPTSFIIAMIAKVVYFNFEKEGQHRLLRVIGRTPVLRKDGNDFKNIDGIIDFSYENN